MIKKLKSGEPRIHPDTFVADSAAIMGNVSVGQKSSIWFNAVLRADINSITIGEACSVQEGAVLHVALDQPLKIGDYVTVGHGAVLHGCTIGDNVLIGMKAVVLDGAVIGEGSIIGAGAVVKEGMVIPPRSLAVGLPAKIVKTLDDKAVLGLRTHAENYVKLWEEFYAEPLARQQAEVPVR
ncbi:MAG: gamma carbonic anhydrase family protein [Firmicutes bacterium]|nr:gamma carbonic anhydrase family protein [Dethiobacter sp.]MBS3887793.1 gamma carbonic anhydrase family protein [Bacillota bacterium]MBS4054832.1 gamma carbonic anhydrase family protein [Thermaerobacter sp.]